MLKLAQFFKVLSDEARLCMLWLLLNNDEICVCEFMAALEITQSKASRHLATLRHAGLVEDRKEGAWTHYKIRTATDPVIRAHMQALQKNLPAHKEAARILQIFESLKKQKKQAAICGACTPAIPSKSAARKAI